MKKMILLASIILAAGLLFVNIYNSMVDAKSWGANIPQSIETARQYFKSSNPGNFFRIFSPINQVVGVLALLFFWRVSPTVRLFLGIAFLLYVLSDVFTFAYFYPRNDMLFKTAQLSEIDKLKNAWKGWNTFNWLRSLIIFVGLMFSSLALHKLYSPNPI